MGTRQELHAQVVSALQLWVGGVACRAAESAIRGDVPPRGWDKLARRTHGARGGGTLSIFKIGALPDCFQMHICRVYI